VSGRVALVTEIAAPYRIPVFNELFDLLDGRLEVFFINETESRRDWRLDRDAVHFPYQVLGGVQFSVPLRGDRQPVYLARPLLPRLERGRFDSVIVGGWNHLECYWALAYARRRRKRLVVWSETPLLAALPERRLRNALKRLVVGAADAYVVPGPSAARYLEALGAEGAAIHEAPTAVDVGFWSERPDDLVLPDRPRLLYCGRLVASKGVEAALRAFAASQLAGPWELVIAGDGPERSRLEQLAPPGTSFVGAQTPEALRRLYHSSSMLVFPSLYDPWGLVLNEAACAGLAAVASDGAGATRDLVRDGVNGLVVPAGDEAALRVAFDRLAGEPALAQRLGAAFAQVAESHTPAACAAGLYAAAL
jgi:glycosyltransferase involved in cell wall biosynthesis